MVYKVERLAAKLTSVISSWDGVECVVSCEASDTDILDPYFALVLDVYCSGSIVDGERRQALFDNPGAFETSRSGEKDRFFIDGLPIRLEYKKTSTIERLLENNAEAMLILGAAGTYMMHRLVHGNILYCRSGWLDRTRAALANNPEEFWESLLETYQQKIEHCLSDLGGAALKDDRFFFFVSLAGFMRSCASALFAINRQWEPSERYMTDALMSLPSLPEDFDGRWSTLMRTDGSVEPARRYQIAQLITRSVLSLA